jgi:hypothetical protein
MAELIVQHDKTNVRAITGTEITIRAINAIEKATEKIEAEAACESRRQAESQGGTTVVVAPTYPSVMPLHPHSPPAVPGSSDSSHPRRVTRLA